MKALQDQMNAAIMTKDQETKMEIEEEHKRLHDQMMKAQMDTDKLLSNFKEDDERMEERLKKIEVEHEQQHAELEKQLVKATSAAQQDTISAMLKQLAGGGFFSHLSRAIDFGIKTVGGWLGI